jgi:hypothetical protein
MDRSWNNGCHIEIILAAGAAIEIEEIEVGEKSIWQATQTV